MKLNVLLTLVAAFSAGTSLAKLNPYDYPYIAHGGGVTSSGILVSNSVEAMNHSYANCIRVFEVDFSWTTEEEMAAIHDWSGSVKQFFGITPPRKLSMDEFKKTKMSQGLTQMNVDDVVKWLREHPDAYVVTDLKYGGVEGAEYIAKHFPDMKNRFIPQIYGIPTYERARKAGFENIIYTLYHSSEPDKDVYEFSISNPLFAVTMPASRAASTDLAENLSKKGVFVYSHTINNPQEFERLKPRGVKGIYTDSIYPPCQAKQP